MKSVRHSFLFINFVFVTCTSLLLPLQSLAGRDTEETDSPSNQTIASRMALALGAVGGVTAATSLVTGQSIRNDLRAAERSRGDLVYSGPTDTPRGRVNLVRIAVTSSPSDIKMFPVGGGEEIDLRFSQGETRVSRIKTLQAAIKNMDGVDPSQGVYIYRKPHLDRAKARDKVRRGIKGFRVASVVGILGWSLGKILEEEQSGEAGVTARMARNGETPVGRSQSSTK
jgi:hypothetical protein